MNFLRFIVFLSTYGTLTLTHNSYPSSSMAPETSPCPFWGHQNDPKRVPETSKPPSVVRLSDKQLPVCHACEPLNTLAPQAGHCSRNARMPAFDPAD